MGQVDERIHKKKIRPRFYLRLLKKGGTKAGGSRADSKPPRKKMDNRGKLWSIDDDQKLMETPYIPDAVFAQNMGRTANAIKMRRSHLAAKMHQNDQGTPLEECVALMNADFAQASGLLIEWNEKRASFKTFLDSNRKRKSQESYAASPPPEHSSRFFETVTMAKRTVPQPKPDHPNRFFETVATAKLPQPKPERVDLPTYWHDQTPEDRITAICSSIREEGGNLSSVFNDPQYIPVLVQHYQGFEAYARIVQARLAA
jgi:hypothetical protein